MRILVTGSAGQVGSEVVAELERRAARRSRGSSWQIFAATRSDFDIGSRDATLAAIVGVAPRVVIHAAAWTAVDACESDPERAYRLNALATRHVVEASRIAGAHVCYLSTDYVFDGRSTVPYREWDETNPTSVYGRSKLGGEHELGPEDTIVRTSWVVGSTGSNMAKTVLRLAASSGVLRFVDDQRGSPTLASDLALTVVDLSLSRRPGLYHVTNQGDTTWFGFAREVLRLAGQESSRVEPVSTGELLPPRPAPRPAYSVLDNAALRMAGDTLLPTWQDALARLVPALIGA